MAADPPLVRRRTVVTGVAATALLAACDSGADLVPPEPTNGTSTAAQTAEPPEQTPDEALVDEVGVALLGAIDVLGTARRFPTARPLVVPVIRAHRAHVRVLEFEEQIPSAAVAPPDAVAALQEARRSERTLHATLVEAAGRAESGALARLLASVAASTSQHLAVLPAEPA